MTVNSKNRDAERGSVLILVIGIVAALALLSITIVMLGSNTQQFTYNEKVQTKAFQVTEAGLDTGMYTMSMSWPEKGGTPPVVDLTQFEQEFPADGGYPRPGSGDVATWEFYDNSGTNGGPGTDQTDENDDNLMYVRVTGRVGDKDATVQALVQRTAFEATLPKGVAVYASGDIDSNGGGNNPKITIEGAPSTGVTVIAGKTILAPEVVDPSINSWDSTDDPPPPPLSTYIFPDLITSIEQMAKEKGRYFTSPAAALASPVGPDSPTGGVSGLCVIRSSDPLDLKEPSKVTINSVAKPGILMMLGGGGFVMEGGTEYYGFMYTDGNFSIGKGNPKIEGMLVSTGDLGFLGTADIAYNEACLLNLKKRFYLFVRVVQGTWREL